MNEEFCNRSFSSWLSSIRMARTDCFFSWGYNFDSWTRVHGLSRHWADLFSKEIIPPFKCSLWTEYDPAASYDCCFRKHNGSKTKNSTSNVLRSMVYQRTRTQSDAWSISSVDLMGHDIYISLCVEICLVFFLFTLLTYPSVADANSTIRGSYIATSNSCDA